VVQLTQGPVQDARRKTFYLGAWIAPEYQLTVEVPANISLQGCRAHASEKCRQRCLARDCALRPRAADGSADAQGAPDATTQELQKDDLEAPGSIIF